MHFYWLWVLVWSMQRGQHHQYVHAITLVNRLYWYCLPGYEGLEKHRKIYMLQLKSHCRSKW